MRAQQARTRPSTPTGNPEAEARLYRNIGWFFSVPGRSPFDMDLRTRFIDAEVARAIGLGVEQIVIIGAGYDGRALRFGGGSTRWFEVDYPATQSDKRRRLAALGIEVPQVQFVGLDLLQDDLGAALAAAGHDPELRSLFICEGLLTYLTLGAIASLLDTLRQRAAPGSTLALNVRVHLPASLITQALRAPFDGLLTTIGERKQSRFEPGDIEKLLTITHWQPVRRERSSTNRAEQGYSQLMAAEPA
ncbi:MAG TPA: SAM-dependent methyltransferase [Acidimicrobiales bacterium]|jgi:methyltransferase (TIGR00027 family)